MSSKHGPELITNFVLILSPKNGNLCNSADTCASKIATDISEDTSEYLNSIKADFYFTSEKVIFPDLNQPVQWNTSAQIFGLDTSRFVVVKIKEQIDSEIVDVLKKTYSEEPPLDWLKNELGSFNTNEREDTHLSQELIFELEHTNQKIMNKVAKIERLVLLEKTMNPIIHKGNIMCERQINMWKKA